VNRTPVVFCKNSIWIFKNAEVDADFESVEKVATKYNAGNKLLKK
jgi:hypothetical protein